MKCYIIPVTSYQQNCSLLYCESSGKGAIVDPGGDVERILEVIEESGAEIEKILLTHGHMDHVAGTDALSQKLGDIPIEGPHISDQEMLQRLPESCAKSGFPAAEAFEPDRWLEQGDEVVFGEQKLKVSHCPGHTPGHVVFYHADVSVAIVGDVLFQGSIGRTDFPGGDHQQLLDSITRELWPMGDEVTFIPGHGPVSTFGQERLTNPFVADKVLGN